MSWLQRTEILLGAENLDKLKKARVLVAGLGGVGAYAVEQLARAGIGHLTIIDGDVVQPSNRNRQLPALCSTQGLPKSQVMADRLRDINPEISLTVLQEFIRDERIPEILSDDYDYVVDAIDTLSPKVFLIVNALQRQLPLISSLGAGGKLDPSLIRVADISKSYNCNLARMVRKRLTKFGIRSGFKVVFSPELVDKDVIILTEGEQNKKTTVGTISYFPAMFGCYLASEVIRDIVDRV
ncbi:tRNA A37 threonylcarbamoyladenosine dehydratase [Breznakibacter xylanolyticus]|uniref:tRNA A37 threonylcarbamoyladenosine dehydratase n=1 Tax=Breznakibacter xylanolyticus TaxID=990 RepID=A0A2W7NGR7_9BACT|nr:tRNA threonylcarbamoyladenosine dehydratase [Breznakibacter xylanolyticus]PZX19428.1 tRNA A37 threonylcarbamoyladenosine dehydratase [Breznakibacter xylanolyticus]